MPLIEGYSRQTISKNIVELYRSGKKLPQAIRISLNLARQTFESRHPGKRVPKYLVIK
jgi:hypothetical protein